ncbi:MAG TPA: hypothetical protein DCY27_14935 [Desulfobacterales bacterium]|nr:hypothetical protein [Desulfobacterales bacterium]
MAYHFFDHFVQKNNRSIHDIDPKVLQLLRRYPWPGNIRELENVIERAVIFCTGPTLTTENLPDYLQPKHTGFTPPQTIDDREPSLMDLERELIFRTLEKMDGNRQQAAQILGISQEELDFKLRAYRWQESH